MLHFTQERFHSRIMLPSGVSVDRPIEIRTPPYHGTHLPDHLQPRRRV